ncbi:hypothetical protein B0T16DRAFT_59668 [Cercophora newfieldiana]|uniref:Uncharacterized protein n=1 Tax=Cercophora newfieldiana TaxID=92897 RepID=A0AA39YRN5_9PEZI|nr:hypothetical protein B0T16DRAFT_59668 [Cercophora newfieldiana]
MTGVKVVESKGVVRSSRCEGGMSIIAPVRHLHRSTSSTERPPTLFPSPNKHREPLWTSTVEMTQVSVEISAAASRLGQAGLRRVLGSGSGNGITRAISGLDRTGRTGGP